MCGFPVDAGSNSSMGFLVSCVEKSNRSVLLLFYGDLDVFVDRVKMVMELSEMRSGEAKVAVVVIPVPALKKIGCGVQRYFFAVLHHKVC